MKKFTTLFAILFFANAFSQTIDIGPDEYAFRYSLNNNFGLFFNATDVRYEFLNGSASPVFGFSAQNGQMTTDLEFGSNSDYLVGNDRYAFRAKSDSDYGLLFNATNLSYDFRNNVGNSIFSIGATTGDLITSGYILPGNTISNTEGAIRYNGSDLQGRISGQWISLTASSGANDLQEAYEANNVINADQGSVIIQGTDGLQVTGEFGSGVEPIYGASDGTRMYFSPNKGAFRAGYVTNGSWDPGLTGDYSTAFGRNTIATGDGSFAAGDSARASGMSSFSVGIRTQSGSWAQAFGRDTEALGPGSMAMGDGSSTGSFAQYSFVGGSSSASASYCMSFGLENTASALASSVFGFQSTVTGERAFAAGSNVLASGTASTAFGENTEAGSSAAFAAGSSSIASGFASVAMGDGSEAVGEASFAMGSGSTANGDAAAAFGGGTQASGSNSFTAGENNIASGFGSTVFGRDSEASGTNSLAVGNNATASGSVSISLGSSTTASGSSSAAFGFNSDAESFGSLASGIASTASGDASMAVGRGAIARSGGEVALGSFNTDYTANSTTNYDANDRVLTIGNGSGSADRSDAMVVLKNGNIGFGTSEPDFRLEIDDIPAGTTGLQLSGSANYYGNNQWQFGQANTGAGGGSLAGDFIFRDDGDTEYVMWTSYFAPGDDGFTDLGRFSYRWNQVYAQNGTINTSDAREKKNIKDVEYGLNEVLAMRPVTYEWKDSDENGTKVGFIAQDLLEIVPEVVVTHERVEDRETGAVTYQEAERMGVFYDDLIPVLAKAIQEQQGQIEEVVEENSELKKENEALRNDVRDLIESMQRFEQDLQSCCFSSQSEINQNGTNGNQEAAELGQNIPNPFSESTIIRYYLPDGATNAIIRVTDIGGSPVKDLQLGATRGANQVEFHTQGLAAGTYLYSLFVDGKFVDTKKMMIAK